MAKSVKTAKPSKSNKKRSKFYNYDPKDMIKAYEAASSGVSVHRAARLFNVPVSTLYDKCQGKGPPPGIQRMGPATTLKHEEELVFIKWLFDIADAGFSISKDRLLENVQAFIQKKNRPSPFKDGRPGGKWYTLFCGRHPEFSKRMGKYVKSNSTSLQSWTSKANLFCKKNGYEPILQDPRRVFCLDEAAFSLSVRNANEMIVRKSKFKHASDSLTVMLGGNAAGDQSPPMIVHKAKRVPKSIFENMPTNWGIGKYTGF